MPWNSRLLAVCVLLSGISCFAAELAWPPVTNVTRPWSRWWWLGSIATEKELSVEMEKYAKAGLGGLEITPIYGVRGQESKFRTYLTPEWMDIFVHSLKEARRLNLGVDIATGNGWPFGGPWVESADAAKNVVHKTYTVRGGESLNETIEFMQQPMVRAIGGRPRIEEIKEPLKANTNLQQLALEQVRFPKPLPMQLLMAYPEQGRALNLTARVAANGKLNWTAPPGVWTLYAVFQGWHGKQVERAGPGGEGDVIDHFSSTALANYLRRFDQAFARYDVRSLRGYFNDSYEVDDATGEANWTPAFLEEFRKRRGYDLRDALPALFAKDNPDRNRRVMTDYRETISDLLLEKFTIPWGEWAKSKGAVTRNQAHGSPANILDLYAASGIPETEGGEILRSKTASSPAHVTGKRLASAEAATWLNEHFQSTLGDVKRTVDDYFLGGINHICYHGTPFSPAGEAWPGFLFYAAVHFGPTNSFWNDFPILNAYVTRAQSFLQAGAPSEDVLLYYDVHDAWAERGQRSLEHFNANLPNGARIAGEQLWNAGYGFDFISDRQLTGLKMAGGAIQSGGGSYKAVVVPETKYVPLATVQKLSELARSGAAIVVHNALPGDVAGLGGLEEKRKVFQNLSAQLKARVRIGADLSRLLAAAGVRREALVDRKLNYVRRKLNDGYAYLLVNRSTAALDAWVPLETAAKAAGIFDPMRGEMGVAAFRAAAGGGTEVYLQLAPGESAIVRTFDTALQGPAFAYWKAGGSALDLARGWTLDFVEGGPALPARVNNAPLGSWTGLNGDAYKSFSGTARYSITFERPAGNPAAWELDLGRVADSARVLLNGKEAAGLIEAPFRVRIPAAALQQTNTLQILVSNLMANRIAEMDRRNQEYRRFYNTNFPSRLPANRGADGNFSAVRWTPRDAGLIGPVTLTALEPVKP